MDLEKEFKKIKANRHKWHKKDKGDWFPDENSEGHEKDRIDKYLQKKLKDPENGIFYLFSYFEKMDEWLINQSQYALLYKEDKECFYKEFSEASEYSYLKTAMGKKSKVYIGMGTIGFYLACNILVQRERQYSEIAEAMIFSIDNYDNEKGSKQEPGVIIHHGEDRVPAQWFILDMYCIMHNRNYNKSNADLSKNYTPYDEVLENWDTTDLTKVDQLVYLMCEMHIMRAVNIAEDWEQEFSWRDKELFVFEIQVWLTFRKMKGLENPTEYSHYFMQEPLSKVFPLEEPLPYPEIPDIEKLLKLHNEIYPNEDALEILNNYKNDRQNG